MAMNLKFVVLSLMVVASLMRSSDAATYEVLDTLGWIIPPAGSIAYTTWAAGKTFAVGDVLVFNYTTGAHDVAAVTKTAYDGCTTANPLSTETTGPTSITLNSTGEHYYICTFGTHCSLGQKLAINVSSTTSTPSPPGTTTTASPPPPGTTTAASPPPPSSAATTLATAALPIALFSFVLAMLH